MILLTRPLPKLEASVSAFALAGLDVVGVASTDITPVADAETDLTHHLKTGVPPDVIVVTSVFAARSLLRSIEDTSVSARRAQCPVVAVGVATAALLTPAFRQVVTPDTHTSEGILSLALLKSAKCQHIVIIKGKGGRTALHDALTAQRRQVTTFNVYCRSELDPPVTSKTFGVDELSGIIATSEQLGQHLLRHYGQYGIAQKPWLTVSERVANSLRSQGVHNIRVCAGANDSVLIEWIKNNWE